jgi:hypothetical protein
MSSTMRAAVLDGPGPPTAFQICDVPIPVPQPGEVLIELPAGLHLLAADAPRRLQLPPRSIV